MFREEEAGSFAKGRIPVFADSAECVRAVDALIKFEQAAKRREESKNITPSAILDRTRNVLRPSSKVLSRHETKELLSYYDIPMTRGMIAKSTDEAVQTASTIGYPVVLKVCSSSITHKSEADAVRVGISDEIELVNAYKEIVSNSRKYAPEAEIEGVCFEEMIKDAREIIVGMSHDPQFGPVILFGLGGVFVEVLKDFSLRVPPLNRADAEEMIREVRGHRILNSFRGKPEADVEGVIDILLKISKLTVELGEFISEIDINPLMVLDKGKGVKVADVLIISR